MDSSDDGKFSIKFKEATLIICRAKVSPEILLAHTNALSRSTAKYPITQGEVILFTLHTGILGDTLDNVFLGKLPTRILICFVDKRASNGSRNFNPFKFQHVNLKLLLAVC